MTEPAVQASGFTARSARRPSPLTLSPVTARPAAGALGGLQVLSLESRRAGEMAALIGRWGGVPVLAPSMREQKLDLTRALDAFERSLAAGDLHAVVCMTGVGTRVFLRGLAARDPRHLDALREVPLVTCGPRAQQAAQELGLTGTHLPQPLGWHDVQAHLLGSLRRGQHAAVLEYGEAMPAPLVRELGFAGLRVSGVAVYRCAFPHDSGPLDAAVRHCVLGGPEVLLLSSGTQALHFLKYAERLGLLTHARDALNRLVTVSIGPACSEAARDLGLRIDLEADPHKMDRLVQLAAEKAPELIRQRQLLKTG